MKKFIVNSILKPTVTALSACGGFMWGEHGWSNTVLILLLSSVALLFLIGIVFKPWNFE